MRPLQHYLLISCQVALIPLGIWNAVETNVGIICACLPSMGPLLRLALGQRINKLSNGSARPSRPIQAKYWPGIRKPFHENTSFARLRDPDVSAVAGSYGQSVSVQATAKSEELELQGKTNTKDGIFVKQTTQWERSART